MAPFESNDGTLLADQDRREIAELRSDEPWYPDAFSAFQRIWSGHPTDDDWDAIAPFTNGRWDAERQALVAGESSLRNLAAASEYYASGAVDADAVRSAVARLDSPVLLVAGEVDVALPPARAAEYAALFPRAELVVIPRAGHSPWLDAPRPFVETISGFLD